MNAPPDILAAAELLDLAASHLTAPDDVALVARCRETARKIRGGVAVNAGPEDGPPHK